VGDKIGEYYIAGFETEYLTNITEVFDDNGHYKLINDEQQILDKTAAITLAGLNKSYTQKWTYSGSSSSSSLQKTIHLLTDSGFPQSPIVEQLRNDIRNNNIYLKKYPQTIKAVVKYSSDTRREGQTSEIIPHASTIFLPSEFEVTGKSIYSRGESSPSLNGECYKIFNPEFSNNKIHELLNIDTSIILRSPHQNYGNGWVIYSSKNGLNSTWNWKRELSQFDHQVTALDTEYGLRFSTANDYMGFSYLFMFCI
jgi:hypothetical protein